MRMTAQPGELLRDARLRRGLSQADLARRTGTTQTYVSRVERGVLSPTMRSLARLLAAIGERLELTTAPLPHGNVSERELRADLRELTASERLAQGMELSRFATELASAAESRRAEGGRR